MNLYSAFIRPCSVLTMTALPPDVSERTQATSQYLSRLSKFLLPVAIDDNISKQSYTGSGTADDPYIIDFLQDDPQDAMNFTKGRKWTIAILHSISTFCVTFSSSIYVSGIGGVMQSFNVSTEVAILGLSLFVLGFAVGPLVWAPLSEMNGRKSIYVISFAGYTAFSVAAACSRSITGLLVLRFFASAFGSSSMANTGGIIADMFNKDERGMATSLFVTAPFLGPAFGPVAGSFLGEARGWRWILGLVAILGGVVWIAATLASRETYATFILQRRAKALTRITGSVYMSRIDSETPYKTLSLKLRVALLRPWTLLFREPIVLLASLYIAIVYGTLYMSFAGIPIVFQGARGWNQGDAGLVFVGVAIGVCLATLAAGIDNKRYVRLCAALEVEGCTVQPEERLVTAMVGSIILPIGLFLFAWTTYPSVHWIASIIGALLFACGLVLVFISLLSYMIDTYTVYTASVLAANSVLRSLFGTVFPLFTTQMYKKLGNQWASSVPAFCMIVCLPIPFLFYRYGAKLRSSCRYSSEAGKALEMIRPRPYLAAVHRLDYAES